MSRPIPPHGTYARANGSPGYREPCGCGPCHAAARAYRKRCDVLRATGRSLQVPAGPVIAHLRDLRAQGAGWNQIVRVSGRSESTLKALLAGRQQRVSRQVAADFLQLRAEQVLTARRSVPALGSVRRLRALAAAGHSVRRLSVEVPLSADVVGDLLEGRVERVRAETAERVAAAYRRLAEVPGSSRRSVLRAGREGWLPPVWWDEDAFDNPGFVPAVAVGRRRDAVAEDVAFLERHGLSHEQAAERLEMPLPTLKRHLARVRGDRAEAAAS